MEALTITWLGHATVLVELDGVRLLTDPVLRDRIGPLVRTAARRPANLAGPVDCVLVSHLHADHLDLPTLRDVPRAGPFIAPRGAGDWMRIKGLRDVRELGRGDEVQIKEVRIHATAAAHDGRRRPLRGGPTVEPLGYVMRGSRSVYFAGDTDLFDEMADLRGTVDVALLPVWGWGPGVGPGHLDPERAAAATALIAPVVCIPIHWGTFALPRPARRSPDPERPAREFADLVRRRTPTIEVPVLAPGDRIALHLPSR